MQSSLLYLGTSVILSCLVPPVAAFSRGAGPASCRTMRPGHIRAQPQDPRQSHVTIRTSVRSYLPGQLLTVTVRSSRDFMGFLLQARGGEDWQAVAGGTEGPLLLGGSWTLTPPGTHTLRCLSEGDTLTHSDKQLKRNLSFAWRAPDAPAGDVRFYITVVQSYFVYWAGIKSAVVRDASQSLWTGRTGAATEGAVFGVQHGNFTRVPAPLNKAGQHSGPASFGKQSFTTEKVWSSAASPVPLVGHQQGRRGLAKKNSSILQNSRGRSSDLGSPAKKSGGDPYSWHRPFISPLPPHQGVETLPTSAPSFLFHSLRHWKDTETVTPNPLKGPENHRLLNTSPSVATGARDVPKSLFAYDIRSSATTSHRSLTTQLSMSLFPSRSNADIDRSSSQTLPTPLRSATPKFLLRPHPKPEDNSSNSRAQHPPASSRQTQPHTFASQSQQQVSYTSKNLLLSGEAVEGPRTRPQAHPQTVPPDTQASVSTRRFDVLLLTTKAERAQASPPATVKSISTFDSSGAGAQSSPSRNAPLDDSKHTTKTPSFAHSAGQEKTSPVFSAPPKPSPVSTLPKSMAIIASASISSTFLSSSSINSPSSARLDPHAPFTISSSTTGRSPAISSSFSSKPVSIPLSSHPASPISTSLSLILVASSSSQATSLHPGPSPAPRRSLNDRPSIPPVPFPSPKQIASSHPGQSNPSTSSRKLQSNIWEELQKPKPPKVAPKLPLNPSKTPGKYPDMVPRHSSWELGMLLGCSAGLGMALVVGVRYVYRQACGRSTEVTLHDRERDYGRSQRGMIHVQECGDLVRVRRIPENSLVLLAEYDILASPAD